MVVGNWNSIVGLARKRNKVTRDLTAPTQTPQVRRSKETPLRQSIYTLSEEQFQVLDHYMTRVYLQPSRNADLAELTRTGRYKIDKATGRIVAKDRLIFRLNLHLIYKLMTVTGMRVSEARSLRWRDIDEVVLRRKDKSYVPKILEIEVKETKARRKHVGSRTVIAPHFLMKHLERLRRQNPVNGDDDLVINIEGRVHHHYERWRQVLDAASDYHFERTGSRVDLQTTEEGAVTTMHHLRSYFISSCLLDKHINPATVAMQVGNSVATIQQFYLARKPRTVSKLIFGRHEIPEELVKRSYALSYEDDTGI
jgi:integrase